MRRIRMFASVITLAGVWIFVSSRVQAVPQDDPQFASLTAEFVYQALAFSPVAATGQGLHERRVGDRLVSFDTELDDFSRESIQKQIDYYAGFKRRLGAFEPSALSPEESIDYRILRDTCDATLLELQRIESHRHNPTAYVELIGSALFVPLMLEYAPKNIRAGHLLARMEKLPRLVEQAKQNLETTDPIYTKVALEENQGNIGMIKDDVARLAESDPSTKQRYGAVAPRALSTLEEFSKFIRDELPKRGSQSWRLGPELYDLKFKYALEADLTPEQLLKIADDRIPVIYDRMAQLSRPIHENEVHHKEHTEIDDPRAREAFTIREVLDLIARDRTTRDRYMREAQKDLDECVRFVREKNVVPLPSQKNLRIIPTPEFMRGVYGVGGFLSAPLLEPKLGAFFFVTPIPPDWTPAQVESKLREYNRYKFKLLTIHEAVPGHYTQGEYANQIQPEVRRVLRGLFSNGPYAEGWAQYGEEVMLEEGFMGGDPKLAITFLKEELRVLTNAILDIRFHRLGMTDEAAMDLMEKVSFQEHSEAVGKLQRAKLMSTQLCTYFLGWAEWRELRKKVEAHQGGTFRLDKYHRAVLSEGAVPIGELYTLLGVPH